MTYLQLINKVLREMREQQVSTLTTDYTLLIGQFVNQAKEEIEEMYDWKALRTEITFNTVVGQVPYDLTTGVGGVGSSDTNERSYLLKDLRSRPLVFNLENNAEYQLYNIGRETLRRYENMPSNSNGKPSYVAEDRGSTGLTLRLWSAPDAVYPMLATVVVPQAELTATTDILLVPSRPVWLLAAAYAASERTGGMGEDAMKLEQRALSAARNAIAFEHEPEEIDFQAQ